MSANGIGPESRLGTGSEASGVLRGEGLLEIHGTFRGDLDWPDRVVIARDADVDGGGRVDAIEVRGSITGRLEAGREAVIRGGARWKGGLVAPSMTTEAGAWLDGEFTVRPADEGGEAGPTTSTE